VLFVGFRCMNDKFDNMLKGPWGGNPFLGGGGWGEQKGGFCGFSNQLESQAY